MIAKAEPVPAAVISSTSGLRTDGNPLIKPDRAASSAPSRRVAVTNFPDRTQAIVKTATQRWELFSALALVHDSYVDAGLMSPNGIGMRITPWHLLKTTEVFVAIEQQDNEVVCTMSLVGDCDEGLPIETIYPEQVAERRARGVMLAEVASLADAREGEQSKLTVVLQLMSLMAQRARRQGVDELLITVHPHHAKFYERFIGFEQIGEERPYSAVLDRPAVALALDLNLMPMNHPKAYKRFFGNPFPEPQLLGWPLGKNIRSELEALWEMCERESAEYAEHLRDTSLARQAA